jgi:hypothetical protein
MGRKQHKRKPRAAKRPHSRCGNSACADKPAQKDSCATGTVGALSAEEVSCVVTDTAAQPEEPVLTTPRLPGDITHLKSLVSLLEKLVCLEGLVQDAQRPYSSGIDAVSTTTSFIRCLFLSTRFDSHYFASPCAIFSH